MLTYHDVRIVEVGPHCLEGEINLPSLAVVVLCNPALIRSRSFEDRVLVFVSKSDLMILGMKWASLVCLCDAKLGS